MPFDQAFALSSVLLATTAFSGLLFAGSIPPWLGLPTAIILITSLFHAGGVLFVRRALVRVTVPPILWNVVDGATIATHDLYPAVDVPAGGFFRRTTETVRLWFN